MMINWSAFPKFAADSRFIKRSAFLEIEWTRGFPDVDLDKQASWAHVWLITSGKRYTDMARFLANWFKRCQGDIDKVKVAGGSIQIPRTNWKEKAPEGEVMTGEDFAKMRQEITTKK